MADITVRKEGGKVAPRQVREWDPYQMIRNMLGWDPFQEMAPLTTSQRAVFSPDFEVKETKESYLFKADVPGIKEQDLDVTLTGNRLTIAGKREAEKEESNDRYYAYERSYGSFSRSFTLPEGIDSEHIRTELKEGVLTLVVPKLPEVQPKKIAIKAGEARKA